MVITFCGHAEIVHTETLKNEMISIFERYIGDDGAELFFGGYGDFDQLALQCGVSYRCSHVKTRLILVLPYLDGTHQRKAIREQMGMLDDLIYPSLERVPKRFAILSRNKWMVEHADLVIAYVDHSWGGAYKTYMYAKKKNKTIINLAKKDFS
jgi:uncharacterized phage-like protein YoqJ